MTEPSKKNSTPPEDVLIADFGETHTGSSVGLMRPRSYQLSEYNIRPNAANRALWKRFVPYVDIIKDKRKGCRLITVFKGEPVDGDHHGTKQLVSRHIEEQARIFADVFDYYLSEVGHSESEGDLIYFLHGTDNVHGSPGLADWVARDFGAVPFQPPKHTSDNQREIDGWYPWRKLRLNIHGKDIQMLHHPPRGLGNLPWTKGNALRSWMRGYQMKLDARRKPIPALMSWGHIHRAWYDRVKFDDGTPMGKTTDIYIVPSFQLKTNWVQEKIDAYIPTHIGGAWHKVSKSGDITGNIESVAVAQPGERIVRV